MRSVWCLSVVGSLLLVCLSLPSFGQTITGTISGEVTDSSGAVVADATVTVQNLGTNEKRIATTTRSGAFELPDLAIGKYKVTASAEGAAAQSIVQALEAHRTAAAPDLPKTRRARVRRTPASTLCCLPIASTAVKGCHAGLTPAAAS